MKAHTYTATSKLELKQGVEELQQEVSVLKNRAYWLEKKLYEVQLQRDNWQELAERLLKGKRK